MADDNGFRMASFGSTRLPLIRMDSIASGIPCPRIRSEPKRAIRPMISAPPTGTRIAHAPRWLADGETSCVPHLPK